MSFNVNLKATSRQSGSLETRAQTHSHTHMVRVRFVSVLVSLDQCFQPPFGHLTDTLIVEIDEVQFCFRRVL